MRGRRRRRPGAILVLCGFAVLPVAGRSQPAPLQQAQVQSLDRFQAEQERLRKLMENRPQGYVDKVMDSSLLPAPAADAGDEAVDTGGFRSYFSESRVTLGRNDAALDLKMSTELGQRVGYRHQTLNYGEYVLEADLRSAHGDLDLGASPFGLTTRRTSGRVVARNLDFPISPTVFADTALGDMSSEVTNALSRTYRLSLGSSIVRGASLKVSGPGFDLRAGTGIRGQLAGGPYPGFEPTAGNTSWLGSSLRLAPNAVVGIQVNRTSQVQGSVASIPVAGEPDIGGATVTSAAAAGTYVWTLPDNEFVRGRVIAIGHSASSPSGSSRASGVFAEGTYQGTGQRHEFGAFHADPQLRFGETLVAAASRGAYWRMDASRPRLTWGAGLDAEEVEGLGLLASRRAAGSANATWRLDRHSFLNANVQLSQTRYRSEVPGAFQDRTTRSMHLSASYRTRIVQWGESTFRVTLRRNEVLVANDLPATGEQLEWEHDWITGRYETLRPELRTTLGIARDRSQGGRDTEPTAGIVFRAWPDADWMVGGSLRWVARDSNLSTSRGLSGTLDTEWTLEGGWRLGAALQLNQAVVRIPALGLGIPEVSRTNDKFLSVYVRWDGAAGTTPRGVGAREGSAGAGSIDGIVFFDANRDGEQQPGEAGVPEVEVFLDGRYRVRTDRAGRFSYPLVGTGTHVLTVTPESVPLPWGVPSDAGYRLDVPLRGQASVRIPVTRVNE